jgi:hypothetical protein
MVTMVVATSVQLAEAELAAEVALVAALELGAAEEALELATGVVEAGAAEVVGLAAVVVAGGAGGVMVTPYGAHSCCA